MAPGIAQDCSGVKSTMRKQFRDSPLFGNGKDIELRNMQQYFTATAVDTFTPCSWKTGQSSLNMREKNQPTSRNLGQEKLAKTELESDKSRKILKAKRTSLAENWESCQ